MSDTALIKAILINAAYQGASAVCGPLVHGTDGKEIALDPLVQDANLQSKGLLVYEEAKIQYAALLRAFQDKTGIWPDPSVPGLDLAGIVAQLPTLAKTLSGANLAQLAPLASQLLQLFQGQAPTPTPPEKPIKAPGSDLPVSQVK